MARTKAILIAAIGGVVGFLLGATGATFFLALFIRDATDTRMIADASIYLTTLERLRVGDTGGANEVLKEELKSALLGLRVDQHRLSAHQRWQYAQIQERAKQFNLGVGPTKP